MNRREALKVFGACAVLPALGPTGVAVLGGVAIGAAVTSKPKALKPLESGQVLSATYFAELVAAVNHANGYPDTVNAPRTHLLLEGRTLTGCGLANVEAVTVEPMAVDCKRCRRSLQWWRWASDEEDPS